MTWVRKGLLHNFSVNSHAQCPTVLVLDDRLRVFYADRAAGKAFIAYVDVDRAEPSRVIAWRYMPIAGLGKPGTFDDSGMMPSCIVDHGDVLYLYYSGWNQGVTVPYRNSIGLLVSHDRGETWMRWSDGPIMDRSVEDPYMAVTPWVTVDRDGKYWQMHYVSGTGWGDEGPSYVIKSAWSPDGIQWRRNAAQAVPSAFDGEAFSRPTLVGTRMWFCSRGTTDYRDGANAYRIRSAKFRDDIGWERTDDGLDASPEGWDSTMTAYPCAVQVDGRTLLFYNGNSFGKTGIGYAEWQ